MREHLVTSQLVREVIKPPDPDSHKGQNGRILIVASSPLFHGAGLLSSQAIFETITSFASITNDMVYFCSTKENLEYLKKRVDCFIGITREQLEDYVNVVDVILAGPGLMRSVEKNRRVTFKEPGLTHTLTTKILKSGKKIVLDAGSLHVINAEDLKNIPNLIITPHRGEMARLFSLDQDELLIPHEFSEERIKKNAAIIQEIANKYKITILMKGPTDIIADKDGWFYSPGGNGGMTKGGTGDVLAGVTAALFARSDDPLKVAAAASFIDKRAGEKLFQDNLWLYNASDLAKNINETLKKEILSALKNR